MWAVLHPRHPCGCTTIDRHCPAGSATSMVSVIAWCQGQLSILILLTGQYRVGVIFRTFRLPASYNRQNRNVPDHLINAWVAECVLFDNSQGMFPPMVLDQVLQTMLDCQRYDIHPVYEHVVST